MSNREEREKCKHHESNTIYCVYCGATQDLLRVDETDWKRYINLKSKELAELFIKEPLSLEIIVLLSMKDLATTNQISKEIMTYNTKVTPLLDSLKKLHIISIDGDLVELTWYGKKLIKKFYKMIGDINNDIRNS